MDENFLKVVYANLNALLVLRLYPDDLMHSLPAFAELQQYDAWKQHRGQRPEVWRTEQELAEEEERQRIARAEQLHTVLERPESAYGIKAGTILPFNTSSMGAAVDASSEAPLKSHPSVVDPGAYRALRSRSVLPAPISSLNDAAGSDALAALQDRAQGSVLDTTTTGPARLGTLCHREISDAGWGNQPGVEAYPRSTIGSVNPQ